MKFFFWEKYSFHTHSGRVNRIYFNSILIYTCITETSAGRTHKFRRKGSERRKFKNIFKLLLRSRVRKHTCWFHTQTAFFLSNDSNRRLSGCAHSGNSTVENDGFLTFTLSACCWLLRHRSSFFEYVCKVMRWMVKPTSLVRELWKLVETHELVAALISFETLFCASIVQPENQQWDRIWGKSLPNIIAFVSSYVCKIVSMLLISFESGTINGVWDRS